MAIEKTKPLPGVRLRDIYNEKSRSWADLSVEERDAFLAKNPELKSKSFGFVSNAYDNGRYIKEFGIEAFRQNTDKEKRDRELVDKVRKDTLDELFGEGFDEFDSTKNLDIKTRISQLNDEAFGELLNSDYRFPTDKHDAKEEQSTWSTFLKGAMNAHEKGGGVVRQKSLNEEWNEQTNEQNEDILGHIVAADSEKTIAAAQPVSLKIKSQLDKMPESEFNKFFSDVFVGEEGSDYHGIGVYNTFKDNHEMKDFGPEEKKEFLANYLAILETSNNPVKAELAVSNALQNYAHDHQTAWDWWGSAMSGIATKAAGDFGNLIVGTHALAGRVAYGEDWLNKYLQGLDENDGERGWWDNMKYWNGVDQYNTFDHDAIWRIEENGGISPYNWLSKAGNERNVSSALNEGMKMLGYTIAQMGISYGMGAGFKGLSTAAGGIFSEAGALLEGSSKASRILMEKVAPVAISMVNAIPIATAYAKGSYDKVYQEATQRLELMKEQELATLMEESGLQGEELSNYYYAKKAELDKQYKYLEDEARMEATSAYERNATIEFARMSGVNYLFKDYLLDKSTRLAKRANAPGLQAVREGERIGMAGTFLGNAVNPKYARYYDLAKAVWGGFESNYMDDVTAAYAQGFSLGRYNNTLAQAFNPEKAVATSSWIAGFNSALASAGEAFFDPQSWYDGLIGALGTIQAVSPRMGAMRGLSRTGRTINQYNVDEIQQRANALGLTKEQYVRDEGYEEVARKMMPDASSQDVADQAKLLREKYGFNALVEDGTIKKLSVAERINNYIMNPLLQNYSDAAQREREFQNRIDAGNKAIETKQAAINDLINVVNSLNTYENAIINGSVLDAKEAKAYRAFTLATTLDAWSKDPVLSQSPFVQEAQAKIERLAEGDITEEDIAQFLSYNQNKSVLDEGDGVDVAKQRLQENAKQLRDMQNEYVKVLDKVKSMADYGTVVTTSSLGAEKIAQQFAFNNIIYKDRQERIQQMSDDLGVQSVVTGSKNASAYGTEVARKAARNAAEDAYKKASDDVQSAETKYKSSKNYSRKSPIRKFKVEAAKLALDEARRRQREAKRELKDFDLISDIPESTLRVPEILSLDPMERAMMLDRKNRDNYSFDQKIEIDKAIQDLRMRDPEALAKIQDIATLTQANEDLRVANDILSNNMLAASNYFDYMANQRAEQFEKVLEHNARLRSDIEIENAPTDEAKFALLKTKSLDYIQHYFDTHEGARTLFDSALDIAKLTTDINSAIGIAKQETVNGLYVRTDLSKVEKEENERAINDAYKKIGEAATSAILDPDVVSEQRAMTAIENILNMQTDPAVQKYFNRVMEEVAKLGHQRDATVIRTKEQKKEEDEWKEKREKFNDGKNYGFDGYKVGDTIYHNDGTIGNIIGFFNDSDGNGKMRISWNHNKVDHAYSTDILKEISKTKPEPKVEPKPEPAPQPEPTPEPQVKPESKIIETPRPVSTKSDAELISEGESVPQFTDEGKIIQKSDEQKAESAMANAEGNSFGISETSVQDVTNQAYSTDSGLFQGNGMYRYDIRSLKDFGIMKARRGLNDGDSMNSFFNWLDSNHIQLQEIIDTELYKIWKDNPDTKVQFMYVNQPGMERHIVTVVEVTPRIDEIHNKDLGGIVEAQGKRYLVIGSLYGDLKKFGMVAVPLRKAAQGIAEGEQFVHPTMYTKIAKMDAGRLVRQQVNETAVEYRTLGELFADPSRNPSGISYENAIMGIMYEDKFFVTNGKEGSRKIFPPGKSDANVGRTFLAIPAANGNYIPVALKTDITIGAINDGEYKDAIYSILRRIASPDLATRQAAVAELESYIVLDDNTNILVGNDKHNNVSIVKNGIVVYTRNIDSMFKNEEFENAVFDTPFKVNVVQMDIESPTRIKWLDEAGALKADVSLLRTANAAYQVFEVKNDGTPNEIKIDEPVPDQRKVGISKGGVATTVAGKTYRLIQGDYYDEFNNVVTDPATRTSIRYNLMIKRSGLEPVLTSPKSGAKIYIINDSLESPIVVKVNSDKTVKVATPDEARNTINQIREKNEADQRAKAAQEALDKSLDTGDFEAVPSWDDSGVPEPPAQPQQVPTPSPEPAPAPKPSVEVKEPQAKVDYDPNKATRKSLSQLEADKKVTNFGSLYAQRKTELNAIAQEKGWDWGKTPASKRAFLEKMGIPDLDTIVDPDVFIDMLKHCK